ncbi:PBP1b-binding outer membrane lipoprotein LpoB [Gracilibacillus halotolerans]|uniref:PBP1b-binding outer membrane lipoprotein LpoB n=1 Tax=Gracilibacillus halotolerans TaxID=74386 RepID=A0A841RGL3_9BACI|nr:PBP1b-binding outer membrane lipoprotein LpoB [Gracilibacillus halotolerans]
MKKKITILLLTGFLFILVGCVSGNVDEETAQTYTTKAEDAIQLLNDGKFEELYEQFDEKMSSELSVEKMNAEVTPVIEESGEFQSFDQSSVEMKEGYYIVTITGNYSNVNRVYTITFDPEDKIAGLFVK